MVPKDFPCHYIINGLLTVYLYICKSMLVDVVQELTEEDQKMKTIYSSLQEEEYFIHFFFLIVLKSGTILVKNSTKFNLI